MKSIGTLLGSIPPGKVLSFMIAALMVATAFVWAIPTEEQMNSADEKDIAKMEPDMISDPMITEPDGQTPITMSTPNPPSLTGFDTPVIDPQVGVRPLLVVLMEYTDLPADVPASFIENQIFGPRPSLNDYFLETSYGLFSLSNQGHFSWITAWDDPMTPDDESTRAYWSTAADPSYHGGIFYSHGLISLDKAGYDFAPLDLDNDGVINFGQEVAYLIVHSLPDGDRLGSTRCMPPLVLDGKVNGGVDDPKCTNGRAAGVSEDSPWITLYAHELAHQMFFLVDYYGIKPQNIGQFNLMGFSAYKNASDIANPPIGPHHVDPYYKMKLGWYSPTVVMNDGFYDIQDTETNPEAYILHDPAHGTHEYFMVENRWKGLSYDNSDGLIPPMLPPLPEAGAPTDIPDQGLLVWHVDETRDWNGSASGGYPIVNLTRRDGSDSGAAWNGNDPAYYDFYDGSAPKNSNWNGGINSKTGIWCVSTNSATMSAWLDVPGPGILVCPDDVEESAIPGSYGTFIVKLVNTGDTTDTFSLSVVGLGSDLTASDPGPITLAPKTSILQGILVYPDRACTTTPGIRNLKIRAESDSNPAIWTEIDAILEVLPFGEPDLTIPLDYIDIYPNETATYTLNLVNEGNVPDTMVLSFTGVDFGTAYRAFPTEIPLSWTYINPGAAIAPACGATSSILTITVPWDWAAMEDALYDFTITATSSITTDSDSEPGQLLVYATPTSMMFYVKAELEALILDVDALPPSDVKDGLYAKVTGALDKLNQAFDRYLMGDDPPSSKLFGTVQNKLGAFLNQIAAQRGKELTVAQADDLAVKAQQIIDDIDAILLAI